ncbi:MAG: FKBP-type peptidyl-prolyl cis-trans isomerase [Bacteroidota bacterium]
MKSELEKLSYAFGINIGSTLKAQGLENADLQLLIDGIKAGMTGKSVKMGPEEVRDALNSHFARMQAQAQEQAKKVQLEFFEENGKKEGVVTLESGLQYQILKEGSGPKPGLTSTVTTHYHGTLINGTVFDSSVNRGEPASFPVNGVISGWTQALQLMPLGSKWKLFVPSDLAYGERGAGGQIPPHTALIFEVELLDIK